MKKVLSLLLVCTMILSFAAMTVVNAATESYTLSYGNYTISKKTNTFVAGTMGETEEWYADLDAYDAAEDGTASTRAYIILNVASTVAASSGSLAIDYDETKVTPMYIDYFGAYPATLTEEFIVADTVSFSELNNNGSVLSITWSNNGNLPVGDSIAYLQFGLLENVTVDNLDSNTFKLAASNALDDVATDILKAEFAQYGASYMVYDNAAHSTGCTFTYPNSDKKVVTDVIGDVAESLPTDNASGEYGEDYSSTINFGTVEGVEDYAPVAQAVVFGKAVQDLTSNTYGIKVGDTKYPGLLDVTAGKYWSIILTTNDASLLADKTYNIYYTKDGVADTLHYSEAKSLPVVNAQ